MRRITIIFFLLCADCALHSSAWAQEIERDPWRLCTADRNLPIRPLYSEPLEAGSTEIRADAARLVEQGLTQFSGSVELVRDERSFVGEILSYEQAQSIVTVEGDAGIWDSAMIWRGQDATFNLDSNLGQLSEGNYWLATGRGRGFAGTIESDRANNITLLRDVDYTTCETDKPVWQFSASKLRLNHNTGRGSATHSLLKVRDIPIFYFPYVSFPLDDRRKSGFLMPTIGSSNQSGFDFRQPYYFNIAPNYDATLTPRVLSKRGAMLGGQFRYLGEQHNGRIGFEYLTNDNITNRNDRSLLSFRHEHFFDKRRARFETLLQNVSDAQYFEDFGRSLSVTSQRFLDRRATFDWYRPQDFRLRAIVRSYQQVDDSPNASRGPYRQLPHIEFTKIKNLPQHRIALRLDTETSYFDRNGSVSGGRIDLYPSIAFPFGRSYGYIRPKIGVRHTEYFLNGVGNFDSRKSRTLPIFNLDSTLFLQRRISLFGVPTLQTLEPRAQYVYIPKSGQNDLPRFDTGRFNISLRNLFQENRFTGPDRIGDTNRLAFVATTRFLSLETGRELIRASIGQAIHFDDREVNLPGRLNEDEDFSDFIGEFAANLGNGLSARTVINYDPNNSRLDRASYGVNFRPEGKNLVLNASYRRQRNGADIEQTDFSFRVPVFDRMNVMGRWNYSITNQRTLEAVGGLEYESCCWGTRLVGRRFLRNTEGAFDTGVFVQFEFKGFAGYGRGAASFLRKSIPGYADYF